MFLKNTFYILLIVAAATKTIHADPTSDDIKTQASAIAEALKKNDFPVIVGTTYPKLVELLGGREKMIAAMKSAMEGGTVKGIKVLSATVGEPGKPYSTPDRLFSIVPLTMVMSTAKQKERLTGKSYLLAISEDHGKTWTFLEGSGLTQESITQLIPDFPSDLKLPEVQKPTIEHKK